MDAFRCGGVKLPRFGGWHLFLRAIWSTFHGPAVRPSRSWRSPGDAAGDEQALENSLLDRRVVIAGTQLP
jgi:hypothetical protein